MPNDSTFNTMLKNNGKDNKTTGNRFEELMLEHLKSFAKNENVYRKKNRRRAHSRTSLQ